MPRGNRPAHIIDAAQEAVLKHLAEGHTRRAAAQLAGVDENTIRNWEVAGTEISERIREAEAQATAVIEQTVIAAAKTDPKIALAYLERRSRSDWGRNVAVENSGELAVRVIREGDANDAQ